uniref:Foxn5 n=1 Tax=Andrias davidianus TaxID=141262 RepID=A0A2I7MLF3_ANDDA|nr:foxn5 [Andrias davidianus]
MYLRFQNGGRFEKLHLKTGLEDWDMAEELKLTATTDQYFPGCDEKMDRYMLRRHNASLCAPWMSAYHSKTGASQATDSAGCGFQPSLWLLVNPTEVCPCPYWKMEVPESSVPVKLALPVAAAAQESSPSLEEANAEETEEMPYSSSEGPVTEDDDTSSLDCPLPEKLPLIVVPKQPTSHSKRLRFLNNVDLGSEWPRPPINYCILISLALRSCQGSLNVQQIYNFIREHFPFFRTAPEGWKNTVRHNLCFSNSFQKTSDLVCSGGKRKSCLWKLTREGTKKFHEEIQALPEELLCLLRDSMNQPALMGPMFDL